MKKFHLIVLLAASVLLAACSFTSLSLQQTVRGSGVPGREERSVSGIERVKMSGFGELIISQGEQETFSLEGDDNLLPNFVTQMNGKTLSIHPRLFFSFKPTLPVIFHLTVKNLQSLDLSGFARVTVNGLNTSALRVSLSGFSELNLKNLQSGVLEGKINGFSRLTVSGQVASQQVDRREHATYLASGN